MTEVTALSTAGQRGSTADAMHKPPPIPGLADKDDALVLLGDVEARLGNKVSYLEWQMLNCHGMYSAAELSPVEAEIMVRLYRELGQELRGSFFQHAFQERLRAKVKELEDKLIHDPNRLLRNLVGIGMLAALVATSALRVAEPPYLALLVLCVLLILGLRYATDRDFVRTVRQVKDGLAGSNIIMRLGEMDAELDSILRHTPVPFNWLVVGFPKRNMAAYVKHITRHLDWYLSPPRRHFHWYWLAHLPTLLVITAAVIAKLGPFMFSAVNLLAHKVSVKDYYAGSLLLQLADHVGERYRTSALEQALESS